MAHDHGHGHGVPADPTSAGARYLRPLIITLGMGLLFMAAELTVGLLTSSLALLSDAAHLLTDVIGTGMALAAILLAKRARASARHTFGMYRGEVLAALANAVLLFGVAGYVLVEAIGRVAHPPEVAGLPVLLTAAFTVVGNVVCFLLLRRGAAESLNVRGAYLEVLADLVGSVGVLVSGAVTLLFGWRYADPVIGVLIGLWVLPRTWTLARKALRILFQHAPERLDVGSMSSELGELPGVLGVHDLHVWTLTSGMEVVSAHLSCRSDVTSGSVLSAAQVLLAERYQIEHATLQVEADSSDCHCKEMTW
jgi:cobalt-zinc-cadmium efflux system protein